LFFEVESLDVRAQRGQPLSAGSSEYLKQKKPMPQSGMAFEPEFPPKGISETNPPKGIMK
jgi:hypothetical protein